jgi:diguanylate cyclase (GGDEF)-like protein
MSENPFRGRGGLIALAVAAAVAERMRARTAFLRREAATAALLEEHAALHNVAALVANGAAMEDVCARVAELAAGLFGGEVGLVLRFDESGQGRIVGRWVREIANYPEPGGELRFASDSAIGTVLATRRTARVASGAPSLFRTHLGERVATPIEIGGRLWGAMAVGGRQDGLLMPDIEKRIERFAELVTLAIGNAEARAQLVAQATTDSLTGVANHGAFHERLADEVTRAQRHGRALSVIVFDVDRFKSVNDVNGHLTGDAVLAEVAQHITAALREGSLLGRLGGDEFAAALPDCDASGARTVAERARSLVREHALASGRPVTISAGVSDLQDDGNAEDLLQRADDALYRAKAGGRDACLLYAA